MATRRQARLPTTEAFLRDHRVFRLDALANALGGHERGRALARNRLKYHLALGRVKGIERGVYASVPPGVDPTRFQPDRFLVGATIRPDGVFSHHAALELLGAGHSEWTVCTLFTERRRPPVTLGAVEIRFLAHPPAVRRAGAELEGTRRVERSGQRLNVTGPERTLLDGFRQPALTGGLPEHVESAAGFGVLDLDLLEELLGVYDQRLLYGAAGWFLESHSRQFFVPEDYLVRLGKRSPRSPQYLARGERRGGVLVARWNLIVPEGLVRFGERDDAGS
jgi:hypothetical protein